MGVEIAYRAVCRQGSDAAALGQIISHHGRAPYVVPGGYQGHYEHQDKDYHAGEPPEVADDVVAEVASERSEGAQVRDA